MMTEHDGRDSDEIEQIERARRVVVKVLAMEITRATCPPYFDDDILAACLRLLEREDLAWLLSQVRDGTYPLQGRCSVVMHMLDHRKEEWRRLREETPSLPLSPD